MIRTGAERQAWFDHLQGLFAQPGPLEPGPGNHGLVRTLGKRCHWCGKIFFAYQRPEDIQEPYRVDQNPIEGEGMRETCGSPNCWKAEDDYQFERRKGFREEHARHQQAAAAGPAPKKGGKL